MLLKFLQVIILQSIELVRRPKGPSGPSMNLGRCRRLHLNERIAHCLTAKIRFILGLVGLHTLTSGRATFFAALCALFNGGMSLALFDRVLMELKQAQR